MPTAKKGALQQKVLVDKLNVSQQGAPGVLKANHSLSRSRRNVGGSQRELTVPLCFGTCKTASAEPCPVWASTIQDTAWDTEVTPVECYQDEVLVAEAYDI